MREYPFEYTDVKFGLKLFGICFLIFAVLVLGMWISTRLMSIIGVLGALATPVVVFLLFKGGIKKQGSAFIYDTSTELKLVDSSESIVYSDIKSFRVARFSNGTELTVKFRSGRKYRLQANSYFCSALQFDAFCEALETTVREYKAANDVVVTRVKSFLEKVWVLSLLIAMSLASLGAVVFLMIKGEQIPSSFFLPFVVLVPLWMGYVAAKKRAREAELL